MTQALAERTQGEVAPMSEYGIRREMEAVKTLLSGLREMGVEDDAELVADSIEGETNLKEAVAWALDQIDEGDVLVIGLKAKEGAFAERRHRIEERNERLRALIEQALVLAEGEALRLPVATLSLTKVKPAPVIDDEAAIPSEFFTPVPQPAPKLDKDALRAALDAGRDVPGARLSNGGFRLAIRRK